MKVFNQEVKNCDNCNFNETTFTSLNEVKHYCNYIHTRIENEDIIDPNCPFNKFLTKEDIENFDFKFNFELSKFEKKNKRL